jgi:hypothetical protein
MIFDIIFIALGIFIVLTGADWLTKGASSIARRFNVSEMVIGLTIVACGTSMPELFVSMMSAIQGTPDLAVGNVVGSNIMNALLIVGCAAIAAPMTISKSTVVKDIPFAVAASLLLLVLAAIPRQADAKRTPVPRIYMFGFAASLNDSIVHFTDIQTVDSVWTDSKSDFLLGRQHYSALLKNYLTKEQMPYRTCIVFYDKNLNKLRKKYVKMRKLYSDSGKKGRNRNDIRDIASADFKFTTINMSADTEEPDTEQEPSKKEKKAKKQRGE